MPRHLVVVGGSYIGLEFAQMFRRFGAEVTVVEKGPRLIAREDEDVSPAIRDILEAEGIPSAPAPSASASRRSGDGIARRRRLRRRRRRGRRLATCCSRSGRRPNTDDLGLDTAGVATDERGYITVDDQLRPTCRASGRWATATAAAPSPTPPTTTSRSSPPTCSTATHGASATASPAYALYIDPPLGRAGMTEAEARAAGRRLLVGQRPMTPRRPRRREGRDRRAS